MAETSQKDSKTSPGFLHRAAMVGVGLRNSVIGLLALPGDAADLVNWAGKKTTGKAMYDGSAGGAMTKGMESGAKWAHLDAQATDTTDKVLSAGGNAVGTVASFFVGAGEIKAVAMAGDAIKLAKTGEVAAQAGRLTSVFSRVAGLFGRGAEAARTADGVKIAANAEKSGSFFARLTSRSSYRIFHDEKLTRIEKLENLAGRGDKNAAQYTKQLLDNAKFNKFTPEEMEKIRLNPGISTEVKNQADAVYRQSVNNGAVGRAIDKAAYVKDHAASLAARGTEQAVKGTATAAFKTVTWPIRTFGSGAWDLAHFWNPFRMAKGVAKMGFSSAVGVTELAGGDQLLNAGQGRKALIGGIIGKDNQQSLADGLSHIGQTLQDHQIPGAGIANTAANIVGTPAPPPPVNKEQQALDKANADGTGPLAAMIKNSKGLEGPSLHAIFTQVEDEAKKEKAHTGLLFELLEGVDSFLSMINFGGWADGLISHVEHFALDAAEGNLVGQGPNLLGALGDIAKHILPAGQPAPTPA